MKKVKILYFIDDLSMGGIQRLTVSLLSLFNKDLIQVDFLLLDDNKTYPLEDTVKSLGSKVYKLENIWIRRPDDYLKYIKAVDNFFLNHHDYDIVEMHSSSKNYLVLKYAKKYGIKCRIAHSHNIGFQTKNKFKILIGNILKKRLIKYSTDFFACSVDAGKWLFGDDIVKQDNFKVIYNSISFDKFKYNEETRKKVRRDLQINEDCFVVGHIGRFIDQKNHKFLIKIFKEIVNDNSKARLLLLGEGPLQEEIKEEVKELKLEDKVIFLGVKEDAYNYFQAMDVFLFPSLYEGLGIVLIEAQASGLSCYTSSKVVPKEAKISDNLVYISLEENEKVWAKQVLNTKKIDRENAILDKSNYDINKQVEKLEKIYLSKGEK